MANMEINNSELVELLTDEVDEATLIAGRGFEYDGYTFVEVWGDFGWVHFIWTGNQIFEIMDTNSGQFEPGCTIDVNEILDIVL